MKIKTYAEIIESLPETVDRPELEQHDGSEILDDIMDFIEIRFPYWKEDLGSYATEYLLHHINLYLDWFEKSNGDKYIDCLISIYIEINDSYSEWVSNYKNARALLLNEFDE